MTRKIAHKEYLDAKEAFILLGFIAYFVSIKSVWRSCPVPLPGAGFHFYELAEEVQTK